MAEDGIGVAERRDKEFLNGEVGKGQGVGQGAAGRFASQSNVVLPHSASDSAGPPQGGGKVDGEGRDEEFGGHGTS
jgi:hypothetical protein